MKKRLTYALVILMHFVGYAQFPTDIPLELRAQFNGRYGYTVIGNTMNETDNWFQSPPPPCQMLTESSATLNLQPNQTLVAAYLYWSGIEDGTYDTIIQLNSEEIISEETFVVDPEQVGTTPYFGSFKDITNQVNSYGNTTYTFSDFDLNPVIDSYCNTAVYYAGWSILIVYEDSSLPIQQLNIYDGLASVYGYEGNSSTTINLGNLNISDIQDARIGYLAWNGSPNLFFNESISFNGTILSNALNPADNPFNGTNSYTGVTDLWNMDLDQFDISNFIQVGDTEATLTFTSAQYRFIQNVVTVIPSELPDATVELNSINNQDPCDDRNISLNIDINNFNSFEVLPANTPYSIFALDANDEEVFIATFFTQNALPIDGTENQTVNVSIPNTIPNTTTLIIKANTLQDASNPINESNSLNNVVTLPLILPQTPSITNSPTDISAANTIPIDLTSNNLETLGITNPEEYEITYHLSASDADNGTNAITSPSNFLANNSPQIIYMRVESVLSTVCFITESFEVSYEDGLPFPTDVPLELRAQYSGQYGYTVIGNTLNEADNKTVTPCQMSTESSALLSLSPNQVLIAAYLYWSGIGEGTVNPSVNLNDIPLIADEIFAVDTQQNGSALYFGSFKNITNQVSAFGNSIYHFSDLDLNPIIGNYCSTGQYYSGWSILVIYEDNTLPIQQLNIYDGLVSVYGLEENASTSVSIGNLNVTDTTNATLGYLAWNGSPNSFINESVSFNGTLLSNGLNPVDNPFNGTNGYTGATNLWNMDLDIFDISNLIQIGDTEATFTFTSAFDRIIQNVVTVIPSELPDATAELIAINNQNPCDDRDISLNININNFNAFDVLPANTPYSIFALDANDDEVFIATFFTQNALSVDGTEIQVIDLSIPNTVPNTTTLIIKANTLQDGSNPTNESNVLNNEITLALTLPQTPSITIPPTDISLCGSIADNTTIDLTQNNLTSLGVANPTEYSISYHLSDAESQNGSNAIANPSSFIATSNPQTLFIRIESNLSPNCFTSTSFEVSYAAIPQIQQTLDINECQVNGQTDSFDLTLNNAVSMGITDPSSVSITYHENLDWAQNGIAQIININDYPIGLADTLTIYVRVENSNNSNCFTTASFQLNSFALSMGDLQNLTAEACTSLGQEAVFDLTVNTPLALGTQSPQDFSVSYHLSENEAQNGSNAIENPTAYTSTALSQTIWLRLTLDTAPTACAALGSFTLQTEPLTVVNNVSDLSIQACVFPNEPVSFDLTQNTAIALGNQDPQLFAISYHTSEAEAENGTNAIGNPSNYENTSNPQTLWLRLERNDILPLCYAVAPFDIEVVGTPEINFNPAPLQICASDNTGFAVFNLNASMADIAFGNPNIAVSFHSSMVNAQSDTGALPLSYENTLAGLETIFFRTEDVINGCSFTGSLDLQVLEIPELSNTAAVLSECAMDNTTAVFDLSAINAVLIENAASTNFEVQYFVSETDALSGTNPIGNTNSFTNTTNPQQLWLGVSNSNNCYAVASFELSVLTSTVIADNTIIDDLSFCSEEPTALMATIDLSQYDTLINPNPLPNTQVLYYEGWDNFNLDIAIESPAAFLIDMPSTVLIAEIINTETQCRSPQPITFEITINPLPVFSLPEVLPLCLDDQTGQPLELSFSPPLLDTGLAGSNNTFEWLLNGEPLGLSTSSITADLPGNYTAIVTNFGSDCSYSQNTLVEAVSPPIFDVVVLSASFSEVGEVDVQNIVGQGIFEFQLDDEPLQLLEQGATNLLFSNIPDGVHTITGRDIYGCGSTTVEFTVLGFAPFFTPNDDGVNDFWNIMSLRDQPNATISIFNRFGKLIYSGNPEQGGWDGTYGGNKMPTNDYWFKVEFIDPRTNNPAVFKSHFTLKR
ncbi:T9SS type B sorting domain-containing protein [Winogradskyella forsetii]|uniref:T9SS type B sorting domain-containing protein n=1 Tax=Winogradskyella forsetii TaxID=2686077 RepID=UPI0015BE8538|nr:T9SS type B sorting domain-containing protein [Winogradskyella forsetii]